MSILEQIELVLGLVCLTWNIYFNSVLLQLQNLWYIYLYRYIFFKYIYIYPYTHLHIYAHTRTHTQGNYGSSTCTFSFQPYRSLDIRRIFMHASKLPTSRWLPDVCRDPLRCWCTRRAKNAAKNGAKNRESFRLVDRGLHETASTISTVVEAFTKKQWSSLFPGPCMPFVENLDFQSVSLGPGLKKNVSSMRFSDASEMKQLWSTHWYQLRVLMMHHSHVPSTSTRLGFFQVWKRRANSRKKPWDIFLYVEY